jgi:hypothetical protein
MDARLAKAEFTGESTLDLHVDAAIEAGEALKALVTARDTIAAIVTAREHQNHFNRNYFRWDRGWPLAKPEATVKEIGRLGELLGAIADLRMDQRLATLFEALDSVKAARERRRAKACSGDGV